MLNLFLSGDQQVVVVFWLWKSLNYRIRMVIGLGCILCGLVLQYYAYHFVYNYFLYWQFWLGMLFLVVGNLFLVVRNIDNRVRFDSYNANAGWEKIHESKLLEVEQLVKKMKKWDRNILDTSNPLGSFVFFILLATCMITFIMSLNLGKPAFGILIADVALLFCPHWVSGQRSIANNPKLLLRIKVIKKLIQNVNHQLSEHEVEYLMLLKGQQRKFPDNVKFCVNIKGHHPDFLGLYGQVVLNRGIYPYFYVVLVAKKGYGLEEAYRKYYPVGFVKEFKVEGDVEVLVVRQATTKTSGYHTKDKRIREIFSEGLEIAEQFAVT